MTDDNIKNDVPGSLVNVLHILLLLILLITLCGRVSLI